MENNNKQCLNHRCSGGYGDAPEKVKVNPNNCRCSGGAPVEGDTKPHPKSHRCGG